MNLTFAEFKPSGNDLQEDNHTFHTYSPLRHGNPISCSQSQFANIFSEYQKPFFIGGT